ncbi:MAG: amino acid permease [Nitrospirae bacterium]|nr:amino acid permease [Nitrospirota bacterium]MDE3049911.1 amino acid permease [Nitrospirota bacterium]MDE3218364.1 amino acid permease [Nitrospirota bacterium]
MESPRSELPRRIGGFTAGCLLVSNVVGSGIFTTTGFMARDLGHPWLILAIWLFGALLALAGALSYSELGTALPVAGGEYAYLRRAYGPLVGFLSGWTSFTIGFGAAVAAGAMSFAAYLLQMAPFQSENGPFSTGIALTLIWVVTGFHLAGVGAGGFLQRLLTILNIGAILVLVVGVLMLGEGNWANLNLSAPDITPSFGATMVSLIFVTYAYSGWNAAAYVAGEIVDPGRTIPQAMIGGTLFVGLLYLVVNGIYLYALPVTELGQPPILPVANKVAAAMLGPTGTRLVTVLLCLSIAGAVSAMVWAGPRVYYAMACDGVIPACFSETAVTSRTPSKAIVLQSLWASVLILSGTFERLIIYSGVVLAIFSALAVGSVMVLRRRSPELARPYRVPLYPFVPLCYVVLSATIAVYGFLERPIEAGLGVATVLAGVPLYVLWTQMRGRQRN